DKLDAWMLRRDPRVKVLKKEYSAGPFPRWNCWVKDPLLARALANELELFLSQPSTFNSQPSLWFVAHSNGAVIALRTARGLLARGHKSGGLILTGAACEADVRKNGVWGWWSNGVLGAAMAYCSEEDFVLGGRPGDAAIHQPSSIIRSALQWLWRKLI